MAYTLGGVDGEAVFLQDPEKLLQMEQMFFHVAAGNQVIVQVCENEREVAEQLIHESLERLGGVGQTKRHEEVLEQAKRRDYGRFFHILRSHRDLVISFHQVHA